MAVSTERAARTLEIVAYSAWGFGVELVPGWLKRDWMDATAFGSPINACR
jgi:hypothetical protein